MAPIAVPLRYVAAAAAVLQTASMLSTYAACVITSRCPPLPHVPTISNTWDTPPGSYLSRFSLSVVALVFTAMQFALWLPTGPLPHFRLHRVIGCCATFCLSWVGAICDETWPACRGNRPLHIGSALSFFILYNINMLAFSFAHTGRARAAMAIPALISTASKLRWLAFIPPVVPADQTLLALVEWADTFLVMGWTVGVLWLQRADLTCYLFTQQPSAPLLVCSVRHITAAVLALFSGTLLVCTCLYFRAGGTSWPYISDLFVYPPGDWISRWAIELAGSLAILGHVLLYLMDSASAPSSSAISSRWLTCLAVIALLGLDVVGCVNEMEDFPLHITGALVFFCGYDMFMWLRTASLLFSPIFRDLPGLRKKAAYSNTCLYAQLLLCLLSSCFTSLRIASTGRQWSPSHAPLTAGGVLDPLLEWLDALCIVSYFALAVTSHQTLAKATGFGIAPSQYVMPL